MSFISYTLLPTKAHSPKSFVHTTTVIHEFSILFTQFIWITIQMLFEMLPAIFQLIIIGNLSNGSYYLAAVGLASSFTNIVVGAIPWGMTSALYTLLPQCIGANKYELIPIYIQRSFYVATIICIILSIIQFFAGDILVAIGQSHDLKDVINLYCRIYIPYTFMYTWLTIIQRLLQSLNHNRDIAFSQMLSFSISYPLYWLLIVYFDLKVVGAAIGANILELIMLIGCAGCAIYRGYGDIFKPLPLGDVLEWSKVCEYISLSLPGLFQTAFEFILFQIAIILSGYIISSTIAISTAAIMNNLLTIIICFAFGISNSSTVRVGGYIGSGTVDRAQIAAKIGIGIAIIVGFIFGVVFAIFHAEIPSIWRNDVQTIETASRVLLYTMVPLAICMLILQTLGGIYRGLGKQKISAYFVIFSYWGISFPLCMILLFVVDLRNDLQNGSYVIWSSLCLGNGVGAIGCIIYLILKINWYDAIQEATHRINTEFEYKAINNDETTDYSTFI